VLLGQIAALWHVGVMASIHEIKKVGLSIREALTVQASRYPSYNAGWAAILSMLTGIDESPDNAGLLSS
jgi:hypothetical protein